MTSERVGWISIFTNIFLFVIKYWVGFVSGSVALIADAWHTLSDSISSIALIIGLKLSKAPPDKEHPYGHGRAELISTLVIGFILGMIGLSFVKDSLDRLVQEQSVTFGFWAKAVTITSILGKEALAQLSFYIGRKNESPSLRADGWHHRSDALSSLIILAGIFLGGKIWWMDGVLGLIVAGLILYSGFDIIKKAWDDMLGKSADEATTLKLKKVVKGMFNNEIHLHHVHMHIYGDHKELTFHIKLPPDMSLKEAHDIANKIEHKVRREMKIEATIHMEPLSGD
ncbi:MAG: cation transporter [Cyclobacteriaceae bacterium]|nr:cation transporter [Cyclobacteriaceae bacterium]